MPINNIKDEELIKLIDTIEKIDDSVKVFSDVTLFLSNFNITSGKTKIKKELIYKLYKNWSKIPMSSSEFYSEIKRFFQIKNGFIKINQSVLMVSKKILSSLKEKQETSFDKRNSIYLAKLEIQNFLNYYSLTHGDTLVHWDVIWDLYLKYRPKQKYTAKTFRNACLILIPNVTTKHGTFYKLSDNINAIIEKNKTKEN